MKKLSWFLLVVVLSLKFTLLDEYNTLPPKVVSANSLQFINSLGVKF